jgi:hypothetical protein
MHHPLRRRRRRKAVALLVAVSLLLSSATSVVYAAPKKGDATTASSSSDKEDAAIEEAAKQRYAEGQKLYAKKRYEEARVAFLQATLLKRRPASILMLAQSCLRAGRWLEAARNFDAYREELGGEVPAKLKDAFDAARREARSHLGRLRFDVPEGAEVTIDGEKVPSVADPIDVNAGEHTIVVTHRDEKKTIDVEAVEGKTVDVKPAFIPKALVPTSDTRTRPKLSERKTSPPTTDDDGGGATTPKEPSSPSILSPPSTTWPVFAAGAIGLGGLAAAAIFGGLAANSNHAVDVANETLSHENPKPTCGKTASFKDEQQKQRLEETCTSLRRNETFAAQHENAFGVSLIVGLSGTAIALGWFLFAPKEGSDTNKETKEKSSPDAPKKPEKTDSRNELRPRIVPWLGLNGMGGATIVGTF